MTSTSSTTTLPSPEFATARFCDRLAIALLAAAAAIALASFRDYGLGWDDFTHSEYGELLLAFYASGFRDQRALSFVNLYQYGGGFDVLAALASKILPLDPFETRRLMGALVGLLGLFVTWRIGRRIGGPLAGVVALALLTACPLYVGHVFMNAKDAPFAVAMAILLLGLVRVVEDYPRPALASRAIFGLGLGLSIGSRVMGGFGVITLGAALAVLVAAEVRRDGWRPAARGLGQFLLALLPALVLAYAVMALVWPWAVVDPLNPIRALGYFSRFFEDPWSELFGGQLIRVPDMPRSYVPTLFALKLPEIFLVLGLLGALGAAMACARRQIPPTRRAIFLLVVLAAVLPIAVSIATRPAMYNGLRHFVFVLPPWAVLGGLAGAWIIHRLSRQSRLATAALTALMLAGIALPVIDMVRLHPYEYSHFNRLAGGVAKARGQYMLDYWGLSFKQASQALQAKLAESGETRPKDRPKDRPWKLAVCGPHRSPQVELGRDFETTWDPKGADFALMLGEFYCATFDAPVLVEIARGGVVYARVYDIRGRSFDSLLTLPGLPSR